MTTGIKMLFVYTRNAGFARIIFGQGVDQDSKSGSKLFEQVIGQRILVKKPNGFKRIFVYWKKQIIFNNRY